MGKKVSFLQQIAISGGSVQLVEGRSLLRGGIGYLCPARWQLPEPDCQERWSVPCQPHRRETGARNEVTS